MDQPRKLKSTLLLQDILALPTIQSPLTSLADGVYQSHKSFAAWS